MTYIQSNWDLDGVIQELSLDEIDVVGGGTDNKANSCQAERDAAARLSALNNGAKYKCMEVAVDDTNPATAEKTPGTVMICGVSR